MEDVERGRGADVASDDYDAVIVGASLAGCAAAMLLGQGGSRVALVEKRPDAAAFKRVCGHYIQPSGVPTLERLGLLEPILAAGGLRSRVRIWTPWGWVEPPDTPLAYAVNLPRERLDPLVREAASKVRGVELLQGSTAEALVREEGGTVRGVVCRDPEGTETTLRGRLVVGADGRDSDLARLGGVKEKTLPHGRFAYSVYLEGAPPPSAPDSQAWFLDPQWAAAFPTDEDLVLYAAMPTVDRLPEFKRDPEKALISFLADLPDAPPVHRGTRVGPIIGKLAMPNKVRSPVMPGLALIGDASLATDPLYGIGCGWAFQSGEWLADSVAPALRGEEPLEQGLDRYRRRHRSELAGHSFLIHDYATGRRLNAIERALWAGAARDRKVAAHMEAIGSRRAKPGRTLLRAVPRSVVVNALHSLGHNKGKAATDGTPAARAVDA